MQSISHPFCTPSLPNRAAGGFRFGFVRSNGSASPRSRVWCVSESTVDVSAVKTKKESMKEVKLWGGRFEESVTDAVEKFSESVSFDKSLYKHDIMGSRAHATMLANQVKSLYF